jgi:hypothetical protein
MMTGFTEARIAGAKYYEGKMCPRGHTRRYVKSNGCVECHQARSAGIKLASIKKIQHDDYTTPAPAAVLIRQPGKCMHGVGLRIPCRDCDATWRRRRRFEAVKYDDIHVSPQA